MLYAEIGSTSHAVPFPGALARCRLCGSDVIAKCGKINVWHWAHVAGSDCDSWSESLTGWHLAYQRLFPPDRCEVRIGDHRADIMSASSCVVELQHSGISVDNISAWETHYGERMLWIFDAREAYRSDRIRLRRGSGVSFQFRWEQPRRSIGRSRRPVMLDLGEGLLLGIQNHPRAGQPGWGQLFATSDIWHWILTNEPPRPITGDDLGYQGLVHRVDKMIEFVAQILNGTEAAQTIREALGYGYKASDAVREALIATNATSRVAALGELTEPTFGPLIATEDTKRANASGSKHGGTPGVERRRRLAT